MDDQPARPGELTCIDANCAVSGPRQADGNWACGECSGELVRRLCAGGGFDHVTFSNEPENRTHCLVQ